MRFHQAIVRPLRLLPGFALAIGLWMLGCSAETRSRWKHFFFEVPSEAPAPAASTDEPSTTAAALSEPSAPAGTRFASLHPPYTERKCTECHDAAARMTPRKDLLDSCKACHQRYFSSDAGHSPVTQRQCSQCHDPHRSVQTALLKKPTYELCIQCHDEPALLSPASHGGPEVNNCIACHDPHFGTGKLLRGEAAKPSPGINR